MSRFTLALGLALLVVEVGAAVALIETNDERQSTWLTIALAVIAGSAFVLSGLVALARRPENRTGIYLAATGYLWFLSALSDSGNEWVFTVGFVIGNLLWAPFTALVLAYPTGKLEGRFQRSLPLLVAGLLTVPALLVVLFDPTPAPDRCAECPESAIVVADVPVLGTAFDALGTIVGLGLIVLVITILVRRWRTASRTYRRLLWPVIGAGIATLVSIGLVVIADQVSARAANALQVLFFASFSAVPVAFLLGILRTRLSRASVSLLVLAIEEGTPLRDALARTLGDPTLDIAYVVDAGRGRDFREWVDPQGRVVPRPTADDTHAVRVVHDRGSEVAALTYDPALDGEPELLDAVMAAAGLTLRNERLQAELRAEVYFMETVTNTAPSLLVNIGPDGRIRNVNVAALDASGYDDEGALRGEHYWNVFIDPDERSAMVARFQALAPDFPAGEFENTFTNLRGEERTIYWRSAPVKDDHGNVSSIVSGGLDITERRVRELELQRERDATTTVLESIASIVVVLDRDGKMVDRAVDNPRVGANRAFRQSLGWSDSELVGRPFLDLLASDADGHAAQALAAAASGSASAEVESELRCADGSVRAFAWSAAPVADVTGREDALVLVSGIEVTERRRLEAEKEREREFLNAIANNAASLMCLIDHEGRVAERGINLAFQRTLRWEDTDVGGRIFWESWVHPDDVDAVKMRIRSAVAGDDVGEHDARWVTRDGRTLSIAWTCAPLPRLDERRLFLITGLDVTDRKERESEVRAERDFLNTIANSVPSMLTLLDDEGTVDWRGLNRALRESFGYADDDAVGRKLWDVLAPADDRGKFEAALRDAIAAGGAERMESRWMKRDGSIRLVEWTAVPTIAADGRTRWLVGATDITDSRLQEEEVRASRARLVAAADEARRQLERNLHDGAQQRLVALSVSLRLAESKLADDPAAAGLIMAGAREELGHALDELRELARGIHPAVLTDRGLEPALAALVARAPVPVALEVSAQGLPAAVEAASYYVVAEALTNIAKYAEAEEASVYVVRDDGRVLVEVHDNGSGGADPAQGSGLRGLADRVAALDGTLVVESPQGQGTTVRAKIPLPNDAV